MTQKELEQKVIDAEGRVAKREAVLKKHNSQLAKMIEKGDDRFDISIKREDIKSATSKLAEAREILKNWQDKLNTRITRDAYLEANTPEILKDFLENWKQHAIGYYREKRIRFIEYRKDLKAKERAARLEALQTLPSLEKYRELYKGRELTDYDLANLWPRRDVDAFLSERGLEYGGRRHADQGPRQHSGQFPGRLHASGLDLQQRQRREPDVGGHHAEGQSRPEALLHKQDQDGRSVGRQG